MDPQQIAYWALIAAFVIMSTLYYVAVSRFERAEERVRVLEGALGSKGKSLQSLELAVAQLSSRVALEGYSTWLRFYPELSYLESKVREVRRSG